MEQKTKFDKENSWKIFNEIFASYDKINRILSFGNDMKWRKKLIQHLPKKNKIALLDVACGSADQILALVSSRKIGKAIGIDPSIKMLEIARKKTNHLPHISYELGYAESLPFESDLFDCITCSFGIRNVKDVNASIEQMYRVLKQNGHLLILEFSIPKNRFLKFFHKVYLRHILPKVGGLMSKNLPAYSYLNKTIESFPYGDKFCALLKSAPFKEVKAFPMCFGAVTVYKAVK